MTSHDHTRPDHAVMRTALAATRAVLGEDDREAHEAACRATHGSASVTAVHGIIADSGACPACVAVAGISFGITLASVMAGDTAFVSEPVRLALLDAVDASEAELRAAGN